jgi:addiction module RelE/StbE family toxin
MKYQLKWAHAAKADLKGIKDYIARDSPHVAESFVRQIRERCNRVASFPFAAPMVGEYPDEHLREMYHGSYRIIYKIEASRIVILRVVHGARLLGRDALE